MSWWDDAKHSNAVHKLAACRRYGLFTDELLEQFSEETGESVAQLLTRR